MPYNPIEQMTKARPPRPPARVAEDLELEKRPPGDAFAQALWRQTLAREIRRARAKAGYDRNDPTLKEKLRKLYRALWGGRKGDYEFLSDESDSDQPCQQRKAHD
ncbi:MAG: hypothetical protein EA385_09130 [Salinarimonadaceae bacterium]|nr:MAG: hypothetical protein EA385_09130 [Salinarimonadaceae bacterium]